MYVGIDVAKASLQVCVLSTPDQQQSFANTKAGWKALESYLSQWDEVWVALEATGTYGEGLTRSLFEAKYRVSVINPARIKAYGKSQMKRHKTDAIDAHLIADFCRTQQPLLWQPLSAESEELKELVRHLDDLKQSRQREKNRLEAKPKSKVVLKQIEQLIGYLDKQIDQAKENIRRHIEQHPQLKSQSDLLTSIPGIGLQTSAQVLAQLGDLTRFDNVRQVVAMVGLDPTLRQSGSSMNYTVGIARMGQASLRAALYMPAMVAVRCNPLLKVFAERMVSNGLKPLQVIVAVMRKLLHLAYGVVKNQLPFDPNYGKAKVAFP